MKRTLIVSIMCLCGLLAVPAIAQEGGDMPPMTPEQMAEMEAYMFGALMLAGPGRALILSPNWRSCRNPLVRTSCPSARAAKQDERGHHSEAPAPDLLANQLALPIPLCATMHESARTGPLAVVTGQNLPSGITGSL